MAENKPCKDHLGKEYPSISAMVEAYGLTFYNYAKRIRRGWSLERTLTTPVKTKPLEIRVTDHKGNKYPSVCAMARAYGIQDSTLRVRFRYGWNIEKALTAPVGSSHMTRDHKGNVYSSAVEMAEAYGIPVGTYWTRIGNGWDLEKALTTPVKNRDIEIRDHKGNLYPTLTAMTEAYGVPSLTYRGRIENGWDVERALTTPVRRVDRGKIVRDHKGKEYSSQTMMAEAYGIPYITYRARLRYGWSLEKALTTPVKGLCLPERKGEGAAWPEEEEECLEEG